METEKEQQSVRLIMQNLHKAENGGPNSEM